LPLATGTRIGRYEVTGPLGAGGMKILPGLFASDTDDLTLLTVTRLRRR
jgi:hypothetical protein